MKFLKSRTITFCWNNPPCCALVIAQITNCVREVKYVKCGRVSSSVGDTVSAVNLNANDSLLVPWFSNTNIMAVIFHLRHRCLLIDKKISSRLEAPCWFLVSDRHCASEGRPCSNSCINMTLEVVLTFWREKDRVKFKSCCSVKEEEIHEDESEKLWMGKRAISVLRELSINVP